MHVTHLQRAVGPGHHSVERIFADVRAALPPDISVDVLVNRHLSTGLWPRLADAWRARRARGQVRHVTGDVHYLCWFLPRRGTVLTVLDCVSLERLTGWRRAIFHLLWYRLPINRAAAITTISTFSAQSIERHTGYPAERIAIIPPPLSNEFQPAIQPFNAERPRVLQVGTSENKNLPRVIEALAGLPVTLVVVGELPQALAELAARLGVQLENHVNLPRQALLEQYRRADLIMFASLYEGFGMPVVEAHAIGRPVITSNRCSMPEAAGGAALLVDPEDTDAIRSAVERLRTDAALRTELVECGLQNAERYRPSAIAGEYAALYRSLAR